MVQQRPHTPDIEQLSAYLDGELPEAEAAELKAHLASCQACAAELEELRATTALLQALPAVRPPRSFTLSEAQLRPRRFSWFPVMRLASATFAVLLLLTVGVDLAGLVEPGYNSAPAPQNDQMVSSGSAAAPTAAMAGGTTMEGATLKAGEDAMLYQEVAPTTSAAMDTQRAPAPEGTPESFRMVIPESTPDPAGISLPGLQPTTVPDFGAASGSAPAPTAAASGAAETVPEQPFVAPDAEASEGDQPEGTVTTASRGTAPEELTNTQPINISEGPPSGNGQNPGMDAGTPTWLRVTQLILALLLAGSVASWYVTWKREYAG